MSTCTNIYHFNNNEIKTYDRYIVSEMLSAKKGSLLFRWGTKTIKKS